jgi:hypothetical protein
MELPDFRSVFNHVLSYDRGGPAPMKLKGFVGFLIVTALLGCEIWKNKAIPEELLGVWTTSAPRCEDCLLVIKDGVIIFQNGISYIDINYIKDIKKFPENGKTLYIIYYDDIEGVDNKLSLFHSKTAGGGVIRFKNQRKVKWTRKETPSQT